MDKPITGQLGKEFLSDYSNITRPYVAKYLRQEIAKAKKIGIVPAEALESFGKMVIDGKGIRGSLVVLGYLAGGGKDMGKIYEASAFMELFHSGILVHDDFMDRDNLRRGRETIHKEFERKASGLNVKTDPMHFGNSMAVNVGDISFFMSWKKIIKSGFDMQNIIKVTEIFSNYVIRLVHGQEMDILMTGDSNASEKDILNMLWIKSGEYTALLPLLSGVAFAGEKDLAKLKAIEKYAKCFGWAFQIQDDYLGLFGNKKETGKPAVSDIREGKNTLFMLYLRKDGTPEQKTFQNSVLGNKNITKKDLDKMRETLHTSGVTQKVLQKGWGYVEEGKKYIPSVTKDKNLQKTFESLLVYMMERTK